MLKVPKDADGNSEAAVQRSSGIAAVWVARNRFAVLDKDHQVRTISSYFIGLGVEPTRVELESARRGSIFEPTQIYIYHSRATFESTRLV